MRLLDRVHGDVHLPPCLSYLVSRPEFNRLDSIRQLGVCSFIFPSATHTRREHSIGVCHLSGKIAEVLSSQNPHLDVTRDDVLCVKISGLLHDIGHGPFSHTYEKYMKNVDPTWSHEEEGCRILESLFFDMCDAFHPFESKDVRAEFEFVRLLIKGLGEGEEWPKERVNRDSSKRFLVDIVNNRRNGVDADKIDYLNRDSLAVLGAKCAIPISTLLSSMRVVSRNGTAIAFDEDASSYVAKVFLVRGRLHSQLYQHPAVSLVESNVIRIMKNMDSTSGEALHSQKVETLTDFSVTTHPLFVSALPSLFQWLQVRTSVVLNTMPRCSKCKGETEVRDRFCVSCGASTRVREAIEDEQGFLVPPEVMVKEEDVTLHVQMKTGSRGARVVIADVVCGRDGHEADEVGQKWKSYDPLNHVLFVDESLNVLKKACPEAFKMGRVRTARCFIPSDVEEGEALEVEKVFQSWGEDVGFVLPPSDARERPTTPDRCISTW